MASLQDRRDVLDREALLLDAGNTLIFFDSVAAAAVLERAGQQVSAEALDAALAPAQQRYAERVRASGSHEQGWRAYMGGLLECAGIRADDVERMVDTLRAEHDRFNLWRRLPDHVPGALSRAREAGLRLGIISNSEGQLVELLERLDLAAPFEVVIDSGVVGLSKPDPAIFHQAAQALDLPPEACLYAGDIPEVDVRGAMEAGMAGALVDAIGMHPDYAEAPRFSTVAALIDAMIAARGAP